MLSSLGITTEIKEKVRDIVSVYKNPRDSDIRVISDTIYRIVDDDSFIEYRATDLDEFFNKNKVHLINTHKFTDTQSDKIKRLLKEGKLLHNDLVISFLNYVIRNFFGSEKDMVIVMRIKTELDKKGKQKTIGYSFYLLNLTDEILTTI